jgi:hypothetical protein
MIKKVEAKGIENADRKAKTSSCEVVSTFAASVVLTLELESSRSRVDNNPRQEAVNGKTASTSSRYFLILLMQKHL